MQSSYFSFGLFLKRFDDLMKQFDDALFPVLEKKTNLHTKEKVILVRNRRKTPLLLIKKQQAWLGSTFPLMMETGCCRSNNKDSCLRRSDGTSDLLHNHM